MVPLFLAEADSLVKDQFLLSQQNSFLPFRFIQFYEGSLIALDSLTKQGMKVEMHDLKANHKTQMNIVEVIYNQGFEDDIFEVRKLEE